MNSTDLRFSGRVFFYSETAISAFLFQQLKLEALTNGLYIHYRGPEYSSGRSAIEKPMAFISHDSRDKDEIARPLAVGLKKLMCPVWYDEFTLKIGDSLRESIEKGLKESAKCVLILSENFLTNESWTKVEFNSIFTREVIETTNVILPVWCGVTRKQVYDYSPSLADRLGVDWNLGIDEVLRRLHRAII